MAVPADNETGLKGDPIPTRFDAAEDKLIRDLNSETGLPMSEIVRRANRFALPKFLSGEIDILTLKPAQRGKRRSIGKARKELANA
jgi:hypothetical protein